MKKTTALVLMYCLVGQSPVDAAPEEGTGNRAQGAAAAGKQAHDKTSAAGAKPASPPDKSPVAPSTLDFGQPADGAATVDDPQALVPLSIPQPKPGAAATLIRELTSVDGLALEGQPIALVDLLSRITDRRQQIVVTQAYWKLSAAIAEYQISADETARVEQLLPAAGADGFVDAPDRLGARLAAAQAQSREAEIGVTSAQQDVAQLGDRPAADPLPLPADRPHAGGYATYFDKLYEHQPAPARNYLIDRSLPLRRHALDMRALAVEAALHAAEDAVEPYRQGHVDLAVLLAGFAELSRQRRAFIAAARQYNDDIAEYALGVAPPGMSAPRLVAMLIGSANPPPEGGPTLSSAPRGGVEHAGFNDTPTPPSSRARGEPTPAQPPAETDGEGTGNEGTGNAEEGTGNREQGTAAGPNPQSAPAPSPQPGATRLPQSPLNPPSARLYPKLNDVDAYARAQRLAARLHSGRQTDQEPGAPMSLDECLAAALGGNRPRVLEAYWRAGERAARRRVIDQQIEQLSSLSQAALKFSDQAGGPEAMLRLRAALCAAAADKYDAELLLLADQFLLARLTGRSLGGRWPLPTAVPHAGRYRLHLEALPPNVADSRGVNRLIVGIPAWQEVLVDRAWSVVAADRSRAALTLDYEAERVGIDEPISAILEQSDQTQAFLAAQTEFNRQIAAYVLAVLPPGASDADVLRALVLPRRAF